jgi:hypothetical protein
MMMGESSNIITLAGQDWSSVPDALIPSVRVDTPEFLALRRKRGERQRSKFVPGPIWFGWIAACEKAGSGALALALAVRGCAKMRGVTAVPLSNALAQEVGLGSADRRRRALIALETAGLVQVDRKPGCAPLVTVLPWSPKKSA